MEALPSSSGAGPSRGATNGSANGAAGRSAHLPAGRSAPASRRASPAAIQALTERLLELRRHGRPPFLVRNLKYVAEDKELARRRMWDLNWVSPHAHAEPSDRHLVLQVSPSRCRLRPGSTSQLLHPDRPISRISVDEPYLPRTAVCRIWLSVKQNEGTHVSFGLRNVQVRLWPEEHLRQRVEIADFPLKETFDLSAAIALIGSFPAALTLIVEVFSEDPAAKPLNARAARLRGEICLLDRDFKDDTIVPNGKVTVPLYFAPSDVGDRPSAESRPRLGFVPAMRLQHDSMFHGATDVPREDVTMVESAVPVGDTSEIEEVIAVDPTPPRTERAVCGAGCCAKNGAGPWKTGRARGPDAHIVLGLEGTVQNAIKQLQSEAKPRIHVTCWYSSKELPFWDGIVRHDFLCPWCHRNCRRLRTLLAHFQVEHDDMYFALDGLQNALGTRADGARVPFVLNFKVAIADRPQSESKTDVRNWDEAYANAEKFPSYVSAARTQRKSQDEMQAAEALRRVKISDDPGNASDSTDMDEEDKEFLKALETEVWNLCKVCQRRYDEPSPENTARGAFCSEFCETTHKAKLAQVSSSQGEPQSLLSFSSRPRPRTVNYKETLGKLPLYHVVSVCEAKEEHFDDDDPDSEEEVDHSWRLDLSLERVRHLEEATPKEKLLFMMWNKYAHENYPIPSFYAERYTRYTLELFALEYGPQIAHLQLRVQFVGFLRALHIHGMIDCEAVKSIVQCLDGKKKRKDCKVSSRPDVSSNSHLRNSIASRGGGAGRGRRGRRRN